MLRIPAKPPNDIVPNIKIKPSDIGHLPTYNLTLSSQIFASSEVKDVLESFRKVYAQIVEDYTSLIINLILDEDSSQPLKIAIFAMLDWSNTPDDLAETEEYKKLNSLLKNNGFSLSKYLQLLQNITHENINKSGRTNEICRTLKQMSSDLDGNFIRLLNYDLSFLDRIKNVGYLNSILRNCNGQIKAFFSSRKNAITKNKQNVESRKDIIGNNIELFDKLDEYLDFRRRFNTQCRILKKIRSKIKNENIVKKTSDKHFLSGFNETLNRCQKYAFYQSRKKYDFCVLKIDHEYEKEFVFENDLNRSISSRLLSELKLIGKEDKLDDFQKLELDSVRKLSKDKSRLDILAKDVGMSNTLISLYHYYVKEIGDDEFFAEILNMVKFSKSGSGRKIHMGYLNLLKGPELNGENKNNDFIKFVRKITEYFDLKMVNVPENLNLENLNPTFRNVKNSDIGYKVVEIINRKIIKVSLTVPPFDNHQKRVLDIDLIGNLSSFYKSKNLNTSVRLKGLSQTTLNKKNLNTLWKEQALKLLKKNDKIYGLISTINTTQSKRKNKNNVISGVHFKDLLAGERFAIAHLSARDNCLIRLCTYEKINDTEIKTIKIKRTKNPSMVKYKVTNLDRSIDHLNQNNNLEYSSKKTTFKNKINFELKKIANQLAKDLNAENINHLIIAGRPTFIIGKKSRFKIYLGNLINLIKGPNGYLINALNKKGITYKIISAKTDVINGSELINNPRAKKINGHKFDLNLIDYVEVNSKTKIIDKGVISLTRFNYNNKIKDVTYYRNLLDSICYFYTINSSSFIKF